MTGNDILILDFDRELRHFGLLSANTRKKSTFDGNARKSVVPGSSDIKGVFFLVFADSEPK